MRLALVAILFLVTFAAQADNPPLPAQAGQAGKFLTTNGIRPSWAAAGGGGITPITSSIVSFAVNWASIQNTVGLYTKTLTANSTFTFSGAVAGQSVNIRLTQASGASYTVTWPTIKWPGGTAPTMTSTNNKTDIYSIFYDGTNYYGTFIQNF
jgi:hypothetical protein